MAIKENGSPGANGAYPLKFQAGSSNPLKGGGDSRASVTFMVWLVTFISIRTPPWVVTHDPDTLQGKPDFRKKVKIHQDENNLYGMVEK